MEQEHYLEKSNEYPPRGQLDISQVDLKYCTLLSSARNVWHFKYLISNLLRSLGFEYYSFVRYCDVDADPQEIGTFPPAQWKSYNDQGFYQHDLTPQYVAKNIRPIFLSVIGNYIAQAPFDLAIRETMQGIRALSQHHGFNDYYGCPIPSCTGKGNVMLSVAQRGVKLADFRMAVASNETQLRLICEAIDFASARKFARELIGVNTDAICTPEYSVNQKPLQVLETLANHDLTISQVADKLGISMVTANKHLGAVRKALKVRTNYAAIKRAIDNHLIQYK